MSQLNLWVGGSYVNSSGGRVSIVNKKIPKEGDTDIYLFVGNDGVRYSTEGIAPDIKHCEEDPLVREVIDTRSPKQAFENLRLWGERTFGPVSPSRIVERAQEEMNKELVREVAGDVWTDKALEEAADVVVILTRAPGLWEAIERKMAINYERKWDVKGDGTGYHIPKEDA